MLDTTLSERTYISSAVFLFLTSDYHIYYVATVDPLITWRGELAAAAELGQ